MPKTYLSFNTYENVPFEIIPKDERVINKTVTICKGGCNSITSITNTTYQLCRGCSDGWRYVGYSCDVPNCDTVCDGTIRMQPKENKMVCVKCFDAWKNMNYCIWERFVEKRHLYFLRPPTFAKALEEGIVSPVETPVKRYDVAECHHCYEDCKIFTPTYQLCNSCAMALQYHGNDCQVCEVKYAISFDTSESIFVCNSCRHAKQNYKIASFHIYKTQIRTIKNCQMPNCNEPISHDAENGNRKCSANIDHDHDTGITRGVLCRNCNTNEGILKTWAENLNTDLLGVIELLKSYLENPPLDKSWTQDRDLI
jgi:hypothetical protein